MQERENTCAVCGKKSNKTCSACGDAHYCSRDHQMSHWKIHSRYCKAYKLVDHPELGKHYIATRNIKVGETVMYDKAPLISAPQNSAAIGKEKAPEGSLQIIPLCLSCYIILTAENAKICKCGWHLCRSCKEHGTECEFTLKYARTGVHISRTDYGKPHPAYETIGLIRALALRESEPEDFQKLMSLRDPLYSDLTNKLLPIDLIRKAAQFAKSFYKIDDFEEEEVCKIMRIIMSNGFVVASTRVQHHSVYYNTSYIENNCRANCSRSFTNKEGIIVWAALPIFKGDHITINYVPALWGNIVRRVNLANLKYLDCNCDRCKDPTEFGTMFSSIRCRAENCDGLLVPPRFSVLDEHCQDYVCCKCAARMPWLTFLPIEEELCVDWRFLDKNNLEDCNRFLEKWKKVLHENHFHTIDTEMDIIFIHGFQFAELLGRKSDLFLIDLIESCKKVVKMHRKLAPAENQFRALVLSVQSRANKELNRRRRNLQTPDEHLKFLVEHKQILNEIHQLLHREPHWCPVEQRLTQSVSEEIREIEAVPEVQLMLAACCL